MKRKINERSYVLIERQFRRIELLFSNLEEKKIICCLFLSLF